jgi:hypothetical protein
MTSLSRTHDRVDGGPLRRLLTDIEDEVTLLRIRLTVTRLVARDTSQWVDDGPASLDLIIADVVAQWQRHEPGNNDPSALEDFWNRYANRVEWAPPDSDNQYRPEFCPANPREFDCANYFRAVWAARVLELRAQRPSFPYWPSAATD